MIPRSVDWWPKIDKNIENLVKDCRGCQQYQNSKGKPKMLWTRSSRVFEKSPHEKGIYFLILVDLQN